MIAAFSVSGVTSIVSWSISAKTGVAPASTIIFTIETQVIDGVTTSSPGPMFIALSRMCIAAVAEESATPY